MKGRPITSIETRLYRNVIKNSKTDAGNGKVLLTTSAMALLETMIYKV